MRFINKELISNLDKIVSQFTSLEFQTRYDIITNPENVKEAYFCVLCASFKIDDQDVKDKHFADLYAAIKSVIKDAKVTDTKVVARYTPTVNPTIVEISVEGDFDKD